MTETGYDQTDTGYDLRDYDRPDMPGPGRKGHKRKKQHRRDAGKGMKRLIIGILVIALICVSGGIFLCKTENISIKDNNWYSDEEMEKRLLSPKHTDNLLYFWFYYTFLYEDDIPFVKDVEVSIKGINKADVRIVEKPVVGYVIYADVYAYFDEKGVVIEESDKLLEGLPELSGFEMKVVKIGSPLPLVDTAMLDDVAAVCAALKKSNLTEPCTISADEKGDIYLKTELVEVRMGQGEHIEEKVGLAAVLLPKLEGKSGVLHLEDYDGTNGNRSFEER